MNQIVTLPFVSFGILGPIFYKFH